MGGPDSIYMTPTSSTSSTFKGDSQYATDLQAVIDRSVALASLPMQEYQTEQTAMQAESSELGTLTDKFTALGSALDSLSQAASQSNLTANSSDSTVLTATATAGADQGSYALEIMDAGSSATSMSGSSGVADPSKSGITPSTNFTLTVTTDPTGTPQAQTLTFSTTGTSLNELRDAINSQAGLNARATIVNVGSSAQPDYRLSIQSTQTAPQQIQLNDGTNDLLQFQTTGSRVQYRVNGGQTDFYSDSRNLTLSSGLTVNILGAKPGSPVNVTVSQDDAAIGSALSGLATAYNAAVDELNKNHGSAGGALTGNAVLGSLSSALWQTASYQGSSGSLTQVGLDLDKTGHISFNQTAFSTLSPSALSQFLGSTSSGFIAAAQSAIDGATGTSGSLSSASTLVQSSLKSQADRIANSQQQIDDLKTRLQTQMASANAMLAQLEQQAQYFTSMFQVMAGNSSGK
jgi:flagellar hook-associated protein 2